jgi:hypothetical protein
MLKSILLSGIALCTITGVALAVPAKAPGQSANVSSEQVAVLTDHQLDQITAGGDKDKKDHDKGKDKKHHDNGKHKGWYKNKHNPHNPKHCKDKKSCS